jgi:uncharacterized protein with HEPN domain
MKPEDRNMALLWDMRGFAHEAHELVSQVSFEQLDGERMRKLALERVLELLGEAARQVSAEFQGREGDIDWRALVGQRNILAHDYGRINHRRLYDTTRQMVPSLLVELDRILGEDP